MLSPLLLWLKALHLIAMVAWFAGLFYMFRIFVYHTENASNAEMAGVFKTMAERLYRIIATPAMVATFFFGFLMLLFSPAYLAEPWILAKIVLVLGLAGFHGYIGYVRKRYAADDVYLTSRQCRMRNEVPTLFLIAIVLLAVLRPGAT